MATGTRQRHVVQAFRDARDAGQQLKGKGQEATETVRESGLGQRLAGAQHSLNAKVTSWPKLLGTALLTSFTFGTFIQVSHNNGFLPKYDVWQFSIGPAIESGVIPFLLAPIWVLYAYLQPLADEYFSDDPATQRAQQRAESLAFNLLQWGVIVAMFLLSDYVYLNDYPHWQCSAILAVNAAAHWAAFDKTKQGALLGALLLVGAPLTEAFIVNVPHLWHYDRPDFLGVPHWAGWCYAAYAFGVGNFGRYLVAQQQGKART